MQQVLIIGGTGIVGQPLIKELLSDGGFNIYSIALDKAEFSDRSVKQYIVDRNSEDFEKTISHILTEVKRLDIVIDICAFGEESGEALYNLLASYTNQFIILTTTLVYDRSQAINKPITEEISLAPEGLYGGYVDGKIKLEKFWQSKVDTNWIILRPYHILGTHSLLGCIPCHNRDPKLLDLIKNNQPLKLAKGGEIPLNFIHPQDIALAIRKIIGNSKTYKQVYNLVNSEVITAKEYYLEIGRQLGKEIFIDPVSLKEIWDNQKGWEMTTLPHVYSVDKLNRDVGFTPTIELDQAISDTINAYPIHSNEMSEIAVHQRMNKLPRPQAPGWLFE